MAVRNEKTKKKVEWKLETEKATDVSVDHFEIRAKTYFYDQHDADYFPCTSKRQTLFLLSECCTRGRVVSDFHNPYYHSSTSLKTTHFF